MSDEEPEDPIVVDAADFNFVLEGLEETVRYAGTLSKEQLTDQLAEIKQQMIDWKNQAQAANSVVNVQK